LKTWDVFWDSPDCTLARSNFWLRSRSLDGKLEWSLKHCSAKIELELFSEIDVLTERLREILPLDKYVQHYPIIAFHSLRPIASIPFVRLSLNSELTGGGLCIDFARIGDKVCLIGRARLELLEDCEEAKLWLCSQQWYLPHVRSKLIEVIHLRAPAVYADLEKRGLMGFAQLGACSEAHKIALKDLPDQIQMPVPYSGYDSEADHSEGEDGED
jgi:hypothetical protein